MKRYLAITETYELRDGIVRMSRNHPKKKNPVIGADEAIGTVVRMPQCIVGID